MKLVVSTWFGSFLLDGDEVLTAIPAPTAVGPLAERARARREGRLTPEEEQLLAGQDVHDWTTADRRLAGHGLRFDPGSSSELPREVAVPDRGRLTSALLEDAGRSLEAAWDPSVHVQEAVRAVGDLDRVRNLIGERLGSWVSKDSPGVDPGDHARAALAALGNSGRPALAPGDPALVAGRRRLGELYAAVADARKSLEDAVNAASPARTPNLTALLGPELAARLVAQAGGLDRLARLPSSTIQVLGAERAFFEHLRGHAPPPRHGLLFLHASIQSAPRADRGKLSRALAGKAAIAARLDAAGGPVHPELAKAFEARRAEVQRRRSPPGDRPGTN